MINLMKKSAFIGSVAFAALPLAAAELTHRWSFNGDYGDSVGGADAVKCACGAAF